MYKNTPSPPQQPDIAQAKPFHETVIGTAISDFLSKVGK